MRKLLQRFLIYYNKQFRFYPSTPIYLQTRKMSVNEIGIDSIYTWPEYFVERNLPRMLRVEEPILHDPVMNKKIAIFTGDITHLKIDAIVNAANNTLLGGGGVDKAIHCAAGRDLLTECQTLKGCETGDAKITKGYKLPAKFVIHTVGPKGENKAKLKSCYDKCFELVLQHEIKTVAFPCISTGIYGYPQDKAAKVALTSARQFLEKHPNAVDRIIFCLFLHSDIEIYERALQEYFPLS